MTSKLFPDTSPEQLAEAAKLAEQLSTEKLGFTADDVLLAAHLSRFGSDTLASGPKALRTKALRTLFDGHDLTSIRALAELGKTLQRIRQDDKVARADREIMVDGIALMQVLIPLIVLVAPDKRGFGAGGRAKGKAPK